MNPTSSNVWARELSTQQLAINRMSGDGGLWWTYLGDWSDRQDNSNIEESYLLEYLRSTGKYSETLITKAVEKLRKTSEDKSKELYYRNQDVYQLLRYGVKVKEEVGDQYQTVMLIDWENVNSNHFWLVEEVTIVGEHTKRPDLVMYINGIALGVLELKRSKVDISTGIRQNLTNQKKEFIQDFFTTIQLITAGNETQWLRYGCIETPEKYYLQWNEVSDEPNILKKHIWQLFRKERILELIYNFIVYDKGIKKICRHNQFFGIQAAKQHLLAKEWWVIWHTQWSGKSLTMVWLAKWIHENINNSRVLLITDREELDSQIQKVFTGVNEEIYRTTSGRDLLSKINTINPRLMCSLVHKFGSKKTNAIDEYTQELKNNLPADFAPKWEIFVFVDECHRTQSGKLYDAMKDILPDATFIGFTGTPLLKKDKQSSFERFGKPIHTYKFDEAVTDKVVLDLRYDARDIDQRMGSQDKVDQRFDSKTKGLTRVAKAQLKKKRWTMQKVLSARSRAEKIVQDIIFDMETKPRLQDGQGNAMLVASSIYEAAKYYELFQSTPLRGKCAVISSYNAHHGHVVLEETGEWDTYEQEKYEIYKQMLNGKTPEDFEREVKDKFINEPAQMKLLIVVDKLLTGFDAPPATYLYIDKSMRDHGLFQAICRVNRLDGEDKEFGYIIDYKDLFKSVEQAIDDYTSEAFDAFDEEDIQWLLSNRLEKAKERLDEKLEVIKALCEPVDASQGISSFIAYFCTNSLDEETITFHEQKRVKLYTSTSSLIRAYANLANEMIDAGYTEDEAQQIKKDVQYFSDLRDEIKLASGDYIDLKQYEPAMRHLIDSYIVAEESRSISTFDNMTLLDLVVNKGEAFVDELPEKISEDKNAIAETIENNMRKLIIEEQQINPVYYDKMSLLLSELIKQRKSKAIEYEQYLKKVVELTKKIKQPQSTGSYPSTLDTVAKRALYDNLWEDEELALALDTMIRRKRKDWRRGNKIKTRQVLSIIKQFIDDEQKAEAILDIVKSQSDY